MARTTVELEAENAVGIQAETDHAGV
jgi:hypothetical protein